MRATVRVLVVLSVLLAGCGEQVGPAGDVAPTAGVDQAFPPASPEATVAANDPAVPACADVPLARPSEHEEPVVTNDVDEAARRFAVQRPARAMTDAVRAYGGNEAAPAYGGLWLDGPLLVAAFTGDLDRHRQALRDRVAHPARLRVTRVTHPLAELEARRERLTGLGDDPRLGNALLSYWIVDVRRNRVAVGW